MLRDHSDPLVACPDCDLLHRLGPVPDGHSARCVRCGAIMCRAKRNSLDRSLAFSIAALIFFVLANSYPLLTFELQGQIQDNKIISGVIDLYTAGMWELAALVFLTSILAPLTYLLLMLFLLAPLKCGRSPGWLAPIFRLMLQARSWAMLEVYMLGVLVAFVKLADFGSVIPGVSFYAFGLLIVALLAINLSFDPRTFWAKLEAP